MENKEIQTTEKKARLHYDGSLFWLIFWFIVFFPIALVFLTAVAFLRAATLLTSVFLRFALPLRLAFVLIANTASLELTTILKPTARWLPNKMAIQRARRPADRRNRTRAAAHTVTREGN